MSKVALSYAPSPLFRRIHPKVTTSSRGNAEHSFLMRESAIQSHLDGDRFNAEANMPQVVNPRRLLRSKI